VQKISQTRLCRQNLLDLLEVSLERSFQPTARINTNKNNQQMLTDKIHPHTIASYKMVRLHSNF